MTDRQYKLSVADILDIALIVTNILTSVHYEE